MTEHLSEWLRPHSPAVVVTYLPLPGELDLSSLPSMLPGCEWALTRTPFEGPLTVHPLGSELEMHRFGFPQPAENSIVVDDSAIDIVLVPGLLFDRRGGRLGRGMGYYDDLLGRLHADRVGVCLETWIIEEVPLEPHDQIVGWLATPLGVRQTG